MGSCELVPDGPTDRRQHDRNPKRARTHHLCPSYRAFFDHVDRPMGSMAGALRTGHLAEEVMAGMARMDARTPPAG